MEYRDQPDEFWKKKLTKKEYDILRLGEMEDPDSGNYVHSQKSGTYLCTGCNTPLFSSEDKRDDGSGYATFALSGEEETVQIDKTYSMRGGENIVPVCKVCGGKLGTVSEVELRSADDLEKSVQMRLVHINSSAIHLKKNLAAKNYPFLYLILLLGLLGGAFVLWSWFSSLSDVAQRSGVERMLKLWIGDSEVQVATLHLEKYKIDSEPLDLGEGTILVILSNEKEVQQLVMQKRKVDAIWLDTNFTVIRQDMGLFSNIEEPFHVPKGAVYVLISQAGQFSQESLSKGTEIIVLNKEALF